MWVCVWNYKLFLTGVKVANYPFLSKNLNFVEQLFAGRSKMQWKSAAWEPGVETKKTIKLVLSTTRKKRHKKNFTRN